MENHAIVYPNVKLGKNCIIEPFCVIGISYKDSPLQTSIGDDSIIRSGTYIYEGNKIGNHFQTGNKTNIRELNEIGDNVSIGTLSIIEHHVKIEDNVRIHSAVFIPEYSYLKNGAWIGPNVVLTNAKYPKSKNAKENLQGPIIGENVKIGAGTIILPGLEIGDNSLIGAGSLVNKNIPANSVAFGHPCRIIKTINEIEDNPYVPK